MNDFSFSINNEISFSKLKEEMQKLDKYINNIGEFFDMLNYTSKWYLGQQNNPEMK
jgi:hypothetical protein